MTLRIVDNGTSVNCPPAAGAAAPAAAKGAPAGAPADALERSAVVTDPYSPDPVPIDWRKEHI